MQKIIFLWRTDHGKDIAVATAPGFEYYLVVYHGVLDCTENQQIVPLLFLLQSGAERPSFDYTNQPTAFIIIRCFAAFFSSHNYLESAKAPCFPVVDDSSTNDW